MKSASKTVDAQIFGQSYLLSCPVEEEEALKVAIARVNDEIQNISNSGKIKTKERIAVMASIHLAHALGRSRFSPNVDASAQTLVQDPSMDEVTDKKLAGIVKKLDESLVELGFSVQ